MKQMTSSSSKFLLRSRRLYLSKSATYTTINQINSLLPTSRRCLSSSSSSSSLSFKDVMTSYQSMDENSRGAFVLQKISTTSSSSSFSSSSLTSVLNNHKGGLSFAMALREDTLKLMEAKPPSPSLSELKKVDSALKDWLSIALCVDNLTLRRIEFENASGDTLEKVVAGEAVHAILTLDELKRRLHNGRRCFGLFHASMPTTPLAFVHIALTPELAPSLTYLNSQSEVDEPTNAMFYSVNSPYASLTGLDMALRIIKSSTLEYIKLHHKSVKTFCTLSPVPGFNSWLNKLQTINSNKIDTIIANFPKSYEGKLRSAILIYNSSISKEMSVVPDSPLKDIFVWMISYLQPPKSAVDNSRYQLIQ